MYVLFVGRYARVYFYYIIEPIYSLCNGGIKGTWENIFGCDVY